MSKTASEWLQDTCLTWAETRQTQNWAQAIYWLLKISTSNVTTTWCLWLCIFLKPANLMHSSNWPVFSSFSNWLLHGLKIFFMFVRLKGNFYFARFLFGWIWVAEYLIAHCETWRYYQRSNPTLATAASISSSVAAVQRNLWGQLAHGMESPPGGLSSSALLLHFLLGE